MHRLALDINYLINPSFNIRFFMDVTELWRRILTIAVGYWEPSYYKSAFNFKAFVTEHFHEAYERRRIS